MNRKVAMIAVIIGVLFIMTACSTGGAPEESATEIETPVRVEMVTQGDFVAENLISAITKPSTSVNIIPKVTGELSVLHVAKGDSVEAGQLLATVDNQNLQRSTELERMSRDLAYNQLEAAKLQMRQVED